MNKNIISFSNRNYYINHHEKSKAFCVSYFSINKKTGKEHQGIKFIPRENDNAENIQYTEFYGPAHVRGYLSYDKAQSAIEAHAKK